MKPYKIGQIAKFHSPFPDENPNQLYVVLEVIEDDDRPRVKIKELNNSLNFASISSVSLNDLEIVQVQTEDLLGQKVTIDKADNTQAIGHVVKVREKKIWVDLSKCAKGVKTNVWLTIKDRAGKELEGTLFVN